MNTKPVLKIDTDIDENSELIKNIKIIPVIEAKSVLKYTLTKPIIPLDITESQILEAQKTASIENNLKQNLTH